MSSLSPSKSPRTYTRLGLAISITLVGANLRAPITSLGPVLPGIQHDLHLSSVAAGALNSLPLLMFALLSLVAPSFGKRLGIERVLGYAILCILVGILVRSAGFPNAIWIGTILLGAGIAFANVLLPGIVRREFHEHAAGITGLYAAAMAGMAGLATGLSVPIAHLSGASWSWSIGCWAILTLITLLFWLPHWRKDTPTKRTNEQHADEIKSPWKHPIGWQVSLFFAMHSLVFYSIVDWYASYASSRGIGLTTAGTNLLIYQFVAIITNLGSAPIIRRSHHQVGLGFICGLLLLVGSVGLVWLPQLSLVWLISAGLGAGTAMVTSLSLFGLRTVDHHQAASLSGMAQCIGYIGASCGPLLIGALHQLSGGWVIPLSLLSVCSVLVIIFAMLAGRRRMIE